MKTVSVKVSSLLGKKVALTRPFEDYPVGSLAVIDQFVVTKRRSFFHVEFLQGPCSLEAVSPIQLVRNFVFHSPGGQRPIPLSLFSNDPPPTAVKGYRNLKVI